jgi:glycosyltransferase involved in cell wall biosynthesis
LAGKRDPYKLIYSSSYDRGIHNLLRLFPEIKNAEPRATLDIYYGFEIYDKRMNMLLRNGDPEGEALKRNKEELLALMNQDGVTHKGRVPQEELMKAYFEAGIWAYPTGFYEISCITGMLAQACGTIPVVSDYAALKETVQFGTKLDPSDLANNFVPAVLEMFKTDFDREKMMKWAREKYDINELAKEWNRYFEL